MGAIIGNPGKHIIAFKNVYKQTGCARKKQRRSERLLEIPVNTSPAKNGRRVMGNLSIREQSEDTKGLFSSFCEIQGKYRLNSKQIQGEDTKGLYCPFCEIQGKYRANTKQIQGDDTKVLFSNPAFVKYRASLCYSRHPLSPYIRSFSDWLIRRNCLNSVHSVRPFVLFMSALEKIN